MAETKIKAGQFFGVIGHGTDGYFLMTNADGSMSWAEGGASGPSVTSVDYPGDDTAADPAGGQTVVLTGTGFAASGMTVSIGGTTAPSVAHDSNTQLTITTPAKAAGDYDIVVTNTVTGASGTFVNGISYNGIPTWTTAAGSLGTFESETTISTITLQATEPDGGTITFNITNGALPTGLSLTGANIDGTTTAESSTTLYSFTIEAIDDENQATPRNFSITVNSAAIISSENFTINTYTGNGSTQSIEGKIGTAASFNGSSSQIDLNYASLGMGVNDFSYSFWFKLNSTSGGQTFFQVLSEHVNYGLRINSTYNLQSSPTNSSGGAQYIGSNVTLDTDWHHVAYIKSSTTGVGHALYYDGTKIAEDTSFTGDVQTATDNKTTLGSATNDVNWLNGSLDQVRFFNKALSSSEITTLYGENNASSTKSTTDIFDDGSGVALYEFEEGGKDTGGVTGYIGSGGVFNGSSSEIDLGNSAVFSSTNTGELSISLWINTTDSDAGYILAKGDDSQVKYEHNLYLNTNGTLRAQIYNSSAGLATTVTTTDTVNDGNWHHVVLVIDNGTSMSVYVDNGTPVTSTGWSGTVTYQSTVPFLLGAFEGISASSSKLNGKLDQVRIFNKALSSSEVTTLYGETSASATKSTTDIFDDSSGVALYELEGNANDTGGTYNGTATNVSYAYDGAPTNVSFLGTSFAPDLVWIKDRNTAEQHGLFDSVRGADLWLHSETTQAESNYGGGYGVTSFNSNGFSIGNGTAINRLNDNYVAWCWKAADTTTTISAGTVGNTIASDVRANQDAGFSIVSYTGSGSGAVTVGHGLNTEPSMYIVKSRSTGSWWVYNKNLNGGVNPADYFLRLDQTNGEIFNASSGGSIFNSTEPTSSVFSAGTTINGSENYIAYCFHSVDGYQKVGSYTGTGASGQTITTGFEPRFVIIKATNNASDWYMIDAVRPNNKFLAANSSSSEFTSSDTHTFTSTGFTLSGASYNNSGYDWIYLAIA